MNGLIKKVTGGSPPPLPSNLSEEWRSLIKRMLSRDEAKRPTAEEILEMPFLQVRST
jgi:serine/threonine protein kinase